MKMIKATIHYNYYGETDKKEDLEYETVLPQVPMVGDYISMESEEDDSCTLTGKIVEIYHNVRKGEYIGLEIWLGPIDFYG